MTDKEFYNATLQEDKGYREVCTNSNKSLLKNLILRTLFL
jgi:hypothetical protein